MIEKILPSGIVSVEAFGDTMPGELFPAEQATLDRAVDKRRREFTTARLCAHQALAGLGVAPAPILPGPRRAPTWPVGVVGSITHCDGYRAASVGFDRDLASLGIDAEPNAQLPPGVLKMIAFGEELTWLDDVLDRELRPGGDPESSRPRIWWDRLLFSAKESVFKAWYPLTSKELDFDEAVVTVASSGRPWGDFTARLLVPGPVLDGEPVGTFSGRWMVDRGLVVTSVAIPAPASALPPAPKSTQEPAKGTGDAGAAGERVNAAR